MVGGIELVDGDTTRLTVDAIVNAANSALCGGGGVDGAIHSAAGPGLLEACRALGHCPTGSAVATEGYELEAKWVIHAVGPVWFGGHEAEEEMLRRTYRSALVLARDLSARSVAFPAISCGAYQFPVDKAAQIAVSEVSGFLSSDLPPASVVLCCFEPQVYREYERALVAYRAEP